MGFSKRSRILIVRGPFDTPGTTSRKPLVSETHKAAATGKEVGQPDHSPLSLLEVVWRYPSLVDTGHGLKLLTQYHFLHLTFTTPQNF